MDFFPFLILVGDVLGFAFDKFARLGFDGLDFEGLVLPLLYLLSLCPIRTNCSAGQWST